MRVKQLSDTTINRIAAGEVIERPASVVKELVENAIDAGGTQIEVALESAGKNLIVITDNGHGMSKEDLNLAIERHTTSKLDEDDIMNIQSFGFRGEALPSIGSVSRMKITTGEKNADVAHSVSVEGNIKSDIIAAPYFQGTKIEVRDLFFATPARLKFLKTDPTELNACMDVIKKIAIAHPNVSFFVTSNGRNNLKLRAISDENAHQARLQRIKDILGEGFAENSVEVSAERDGISVSGFVSLPTYNRASAQDQYLFVNNRPVKDKLLISAIRVAYQDFLARDRHALVVLCLEIEPTAVDVNVHPAKSEVRFHNSGIVRGVLINAIKDAISSTGHRASTSTASTALNYMSNSISPANNHRYEQAEPNYNRLNDSASNNYISSPISEPMRAQSALFQAQNAEFADVMERSEPQAFTSSVREYHYDSPEQKQQLAAKPLGAACAQLHETYIISQTEDAIIITDQHAAHERLVYEELKQDIASSGIVKQRLLIPEIIELPDTERANILDKRKSELAELGFIFDRFGEKSITITEIPQILSKTNLEQLANDLSDNFLDLGENIALSEIIEHITETFACHHSIRSGRRMKLEEMNELLRQMEATPFSGQCNHGRPTYVELKLKDVEKLFGRR